MNKVLLVRFSVAAVWLYQGLWCKVLGRAPRHEAVIENVPFMSPAQAHRMSVALGVLECLLAIWILDGHWGYASALTQTILLFVMNAGGLLWSRRLIPDPAGMLVQNLAFILLVWIAAGEFTPYAASH